MKQIAAEKLFWAVIEDRDYFFAVTTGESAAEGLEMFLGNLSELVAICDDGCAGKPRFNEDRSRVSVEPTRKAPGCLTGCTREYHVEPLTLEFWTNPESRGYEAVSGGLDFHLATPNEDGGFNTAMSDEEYNVLVAQEKLYEAQQLVKA